MTSREGFGQYAYPWLKELAEALEKAAEIADAKLRCHFCAWLITQSQSPAKMLP